MKRIRMISFLCFEERTNKQEDEEHKRIDKKKSRRQSPRPPIVDNGFLNTPSFFHYYFSYLTFKRIYIDTSFYFGTMACGAPGVAPSTVPKP